MPFWGGGWSNPYWEPKRPFRFVVPFPVIVPNEDETVSSIAALAASGRFPWNKYEGQTFDYPCIRCKKPSFSADLLRGANVVGGFQPYLKNAPASYEFTPVELELVDTYNFDLEATLTAYLYGGGELDGHNPKAPPTSYVSTPRPIPISNIAYDSPDFEIIELLDITAHHGPSITGPSAGSIETAFAQRSPQGGASSAVEAGHPEYQLYRARKFILKNALIAGASFGEHSQDTNGLSTVSVQIVYDSYDYEWILYRPDPQWTQKRVTKRYQESYIDVNPDSLSKAQLTALEAEWRHQDDEVARVKELMKQQQVFEENRQQGEEARKEGALVDIEVQLNRPLQEAVRRHATGEKLRPEDEAAIAGASTEAVQAAAKADAEERLAEAAAVAAADAEAIASTPVVYELDPDASETTRVWAEEQGLVLREVPAEPAPAEATEPRVDFGEMGGKGPGEETPVQQALDAEAIAPADDALEVDPDAANPERAQAHIDLINRLDEEAERPPPASDLPAEPEPERLGGGRSETPREEVERLEREAQEETPVATDPATTTSTTSDDDDAAPYAPASDQIETALPSADAADDDTPPYELAAPEEFPSDAAVATSASEPESANEDVQSGQQQQQQPATVADRDPTVPPTAPQRAAEAAGYDTVEEWRAAGSPVSGPDPLTESNLDDDFGIRPSGKPGEESYLDVVEPEPGEHPAVQPSQGGFGPDPSEGLAEGETIYTLQGEPEGEVITAQIVGPTEADADYLADLLSGEGDVAEVVLPIDTSTLRDHPATGQGFHIVSGIGRRSLGHHRGIDVRAQTGATAVAIGHGEVIFAQRWGGYGNAVIITLDDGYEVLYGHLSEISVEVGDVVAAGQQIGLTGASGLDLSRPGVGPHLHFEVHEPGHSYDATPGNRGEIDPCTYFAQVGLSCG